MNVKFEPKEVIKPVKTFWNSYLACFEHAVELRTPIEDYIFAKIEDNRKLVPRRRGRERGQRVKPRLFIEERGLNARDWGTITEYIQLLKPFQEATSWLEGRGKSGKHGAI